MSEHINLRKIDEALGRGNDIIIRRQKINGQLVDTVFESRVKILQRVQLAESEIRDKRTIDCESNHAQR